MPTPFSAAACTAFTTPSESYGFRRRTSHPLVTRFSICETCVSRELSAARILQFSTPRSVHACSIPFCIATKNGCTFCPKDTPIVMSFASLFSAAETTVAPVKSDVAIAAVHKMLINFFFICISSNLW